MRLAHFDCRLKKHAKISLSPLRRFFTGSPFFFPYVLFILITVAPVENVLWEANWISLPCDDFATLWDRFSVIGYALNGGVLVVNIATFGQNVVASTPLIIGHLPNLQPFKGPDLLLPKLYILKKEAKDYYCYYYFSRYDHILLCWKIQKWKHVKRRPFYDVLYTLLLVAVCPMAARVHCKRQDKPAAETVKL